MVLTFKKHIFFISTPITVVCFLFNFFINNKHLIHLNRYVHDVYVFNKCCIYMYLIIKHF